MAAKKLRPRRGKASTLATKNPVLAAGEIIFEVPDTGVGTGASKLKMGDGSTAYNDLPYAMGDAQDPSDSTITYSNSESTDNATLLGEIVSGRALKSLFGSIKPLLTNLDSSVTELNNNLCDYRLISPIVLVATSLV